MKLSRVHIAFILVLSCLYLPFTLALADAAGREEEKFIVPTGRITLADAITAALANNPDIAAASHEIWAREGAGLQKGLLANPRFFSEFEEFGGSGEFSGVDALGTTVGISQEIPLAGKRDKRVRIAEHETDIARLELQEKIVALSRNVKKRFLRVYFLDQSLLLETKNIALLQDVQDVISRQIALGDISPLDERKTTVELALAKSTLARAKRELEMARIELASSWGSREVYFDQVEFSDQTIQLLPEEDELWQTAQGHPEMKIKQMQIEQLKASLDLAKADAVPDLEVEGGVKYFNESNDHAYFLGFSIPIPIFDRNKGGIREAAENIHKGKKELAGASSRMRTELAVLLERLQIIVEESDTTETTIIPAAHEAYEALKKAYEAGEKDYLELLDSQRILIEVQRQNLLLKTEHHDLIADLEAITAKDLGSFSRYHMDSPE
ncbi:MAG: TolC family protein [Pseudomonadota bacterium]